VSVHHGLDEGRGLVVGCGYGLDQRLDAGIGLTAGDGLGLAVGKGVGRTCKSQRGQKK